MAAGYYVVAYASSYNGALLGMVVAGLGFGLYVPNHSSWILSIVSPQRRGFGVGIVPRIVLDNSPLADQVQVLDVRPRLEAYEVGLFTLEKKLRSPLINAFWSQLE